MPVSLNLKNLISDSRDFHYLQRAHEFPGGRVLLDIVEQLRDRERGEIERNPMLDPIEIKKDLRFRLGMVAMANLILDLPNRALKHIHQLEGRE